MSGLFKVLEPIQNQNLQRKHAQEKMLDDQTIFLAYKPQTAERENKKY